MIDDLNNGSAQLPTGSNLYFSHNYVKWGIPSDVTISDVRVDSISLDYLNKDYMKNETLFIPVIPGATTLYVTINGEPVEVLMQNVATSTQIKHIPKKSSTTSDIATTGTASTSSNTSTSTFLIASHTGEMSAIFNFKVGGDAYFTINSEYTGGYISTTSCANVTVNSNTIYRQCRTHSNPTYPSSISLMDSLTSQDELRD